MNRELMALIAHAVPKEQLLENIMEAAVDCQMSPDDKEKENILSAHIQMWMLKRVIEKEGLDKLLEDWKKFNAREALFNPEKN